MELSCDRSAVEHNASNSAQLVYSLRKNGTDRVYQTFPLNDIRLADDRPWRTWNHSFNVPPADPDEDLAIYVLQSGNGSVQLHDLRIAVSAMK